MKRSLLAIWLLSFITCLVGYSSFLIKDEANYEISTSKIDVSKPVCYNTSSNTYYTTIEKGLSEASSGQQINVIPGSSPTITRDCEIKSGVTLNLAPVVEETTYGNASLSFSNWDSSTSKGSVIFKLKKNSKDYLSWSGSYSLASSTTSFTVSDGIEAKCSSHIISKGSTTINSVSYKKATLSFTSQTVNGVTSTIEQSFKTSLSKASGSGSFDCGKKWYSECVGSSGKTITWNISYTSKVSFSISSISVNGITEYIGQSFAFTSTTSNVNNTTFDFSSGSSMGSWSSDDSVTIPDYSNVTNYGSTQFDDNTISGSSNCTVFIEDNITLTNNGNLYIGGTLACGSGTTNMGGYAGQTYGAYSELVLGKSSSLINNKNLYVYGYISEESKDNGSIVDNKSGSTTLVPFVVRDYRGGSMTVSCYNSKDEKGAFPFNQYEVRNISSLVYYRYGSKLEGKADLYASSEHHTTTMTILYNDSNSFIQLTNSSGYMKAKFTELEKYNSSRTGKGSTSIDIYGGCAFNSMSLTVSVNASILETLSKTVVSSDFYFPISYREKIGLYKLDSESSAIYTASDKYQFLPGSSLTIGSGVTLNAGTLVFYKEFPTSTSVYPDAYKRYYYDTTNKDKTVTIETKDAAYLLNNGTVNVTNFGGLLKSDVSGASITISSGVSVTTYQAMSVESGITNTVAILKGTDKNSYMSLTNTATYTDGTSISNSGTYTSSSKNDGYGFYSS